MQGAPQRNPLVDTLSILDSFLMDLSKLETQNQELKEFHRTFRRDADLERNSQEDVTKRFIKPIIKKLKRHSRPILFKDEEIFQEPLQLFDDSVDISSVYDLNESVRSVLWDYLEQLYVIGSLVTLPVEKQRRFLQLIFQLKQSQAPAQPEISEDMDEAVGQLSQMFGFDSNDPNGQAMQSMIGDIAKSVNDIMSGTDDPQALLQSIMTGESGQFQRLIQDVQSKIEGKIESGDLDPNAMRDQAMRMSQVMQSPQIGAMMGMMGGGGGGEGGNGSEGGFNPMSMMMSMMGGGGGTQQFYPPQPQNEMESVTENTNENIDKSE